MSKQVDVDGKARQRGSSLQKVILKDGSLRWRFRLDLEPGPDGKRRQRTLTFATEAEAVAAQSKARTEVSEGDHIEPTKVTLGEWLDTWLQVGARGWKPSTLASYRVALAPVRAALGSQRVQDLRRPDLEAMVRALESSSDRPSKAMRSPRTVAYALFLTRKALDAAVADEIIRRNPAEHVKPPSQPATEMETWTAEEMQRFLAVVADDELAGVWHLTALGLRRGEVLGVRWSDVDLDAGIVRIRQARVQAGREVVTVEPKTRRGRRDVPLHPAAIEALRRTRQRTVLESTSIPFQTKRDVGRLVAVDAAGLPVSPDAYSKAFLAHVAAAGVKRIRLHDVRHTAATLMLGQGIPPTVVAGILGHSPDVLLRVYAHALPEAKRDAVNLLGSLYASGA